MASSSTAHVGANCIVRGRPVPAHSPAGVKLIVESIGRRALMVHRGVGKKNDEEWAKAVGETTEKPLTYRAMRRWELGRGGGIYLQHGGPEGGPPADLRAERGRSLAGEQLVAWVEWNQG